MYRLFSLLVIALTIPLPRLSGQGLANASNPFLKIFHEDGFGLYPASLLLDYDNRYVALLKVRTGFGESGPAVYTLDSSGVELQSRYYDNKWRDVIEPVQIQQYADGRYLVFSTYRADYSGYLIFNRNLNLVKIVGNGLDTTLIAPYFFIPRSDDGILAVAKIREGSGLNSLSYPILMYRDANLDTLWTRRYRFYHREPGWRNFRDTSVGLRNGIQTRNGDFLNVGFMESNDQNLNATYRHLFLFRTDSSGNVIWKTQQLTTWCPKIGNAVFEASDGSLFIAGLTAVGGNGQTRAGLWKVSGSDGTILWSQIYGRGAKRIKTYDLTYRFPEGPTQFLFIEPTSDGNLLLAGSIEGPKLDSTANLYIIKVDQDGNELWNREVDIDSFDVPSAMIKTNDGGYAILGWTSATPYPHSDRTNMFLLKTNDNGDITSVTSIDGNPVSFRLEQSYPNPARSAASDVIIPFVLDRKAHVSLSLYDEFGRLSRTLFDGELEPGHQSVHVDTHDLARGMYVYRLQSSFETKTGKLIVMR